MIVMFIGQEVWCQGTRIEVGSWNPVGSGARALGMGGAFIAVADDATAASWNPGGLIQLERPEVSVVGNYFHRVEDLYFGTNPEASGCEDFSFAGINYLSAAYPFSLAGRNMVVSLNYQNLYDFTRQWKFTTDLSSNFSVDYDYEAEGSLGAIGLAYSMQISPMFSLGFTINFWDDDLCDNSWEQNLDFTGAGLVTLEANWYDKYSFEGINANFGFLWHATTNLTLGGVFKTPFRADLHHEWKHYETINGILSENIDQEDLKVDMPMSYGLGIAYRFSDEFTMSLDVYHTEWDDFVLWDSDGEKKSPVTGESFSDSGIEPTTQVRTGAEYLFIKDKYVIPARFGLFFDPAPAEGSPDYYYGVSTGTGIAYGRFIFDISYQYRFANNANEFILRDFDFSLDAQEHTVYASIILHF